MVHQAGKFPGKGFHDYRFKPLQPRQQGIVDETDPIFPVQGDDTSHRKVNRFLDAGNPGILLEERRFTDSNQEDRRGGSQDIECFQGQGIQE